MGATLFRQQDDFWEAGENPARERRCNCPRYPHMPLSGHRRMGRRGTLSGQKSEDRPVVWK